MLSPPPWAGAVFQSRAALGNFGSVVLGAWQLAEPQGEQGEGLQSSSWATEWGQWWGASAGKCDQLCAEPWGVCPAGCLGSVSALHLGPSGR